MTDKKEQDNYKQLMKLIPGLLELEGETQLKVSNSRYIDVKVISKIPPLITAKTKSDYPLVISLSLLKQESNGHAVNEQIMTVRIFESSKSLYIIDYKDKIASPEINFEESCANRFMTREINARVGQWLKNCLSKV